jgi:hypothetical protein
MIRISTLLKGHHQVATDTSALLLQIQSNGTTTRVDLQHILKLFEADWAYYRVSSSFKATTTGFVLFWRDSSDGEFDSRRMRRVKTRSIISLVHNTCRTIRNSCIHHEHVSMSTKDLSEKDHETRTGLEPIVPDNRSVVLPSSTIQSSSWS